MMDFKSTLPHTSISTQGIRGVILTDIIWDTGTDISRHVSSDQFASYYKTDNVLIEWTVRLDHKGAGFYMEIDIHKITGIHYCEFLDSDRDLDDQDIEFEFNDDLESKWELKAESFYDNKQFSHQAIPHAMFPKGMSIDYNTKECVVYYGR